MNFWERFDGEFARILCDVEAAARSVVASALTF